MKLSELSEAGRPRLVESIIRSRKKIYFRSWAEEVRKLIPPSVKDTSFLWKQFLEQSRPTWEFHRAMLYEKPMDELHDLHAKELKRARECGQVIDMKDHKKCISMER